MTNKFKKLLKSLTLSKNKLKFNILEYKKLSKFSLSLMNSSMCITGFLIGKYNCILDIKIIYLGLSSFLLACSSQSAGQILEVKEDSLMERTKNRPLIIKSISLKNAYIFTSFNYIMSNIIIYNFFDMRTLFIANTIYFGYIFGYIPLKKKTKLNTIYGAIIGSLPILYGWSANGLDFFSDLSPFYLSFFMLAWQIPHFYGILWNYKNQYDIAKFNMINDPNKASKNMYYAIVVKILSVIGLAHEGCIGPIFFLLTLNSLYSGSYKSIYNFRMEQNIKNSKNLKINAYKSILFLILGILFELGGLNYDTKILKIWYNK